MHFTLSLFLIKRFLKTIAVAYSVILTTFMIVNLAELLKRGTGKKVSFLNCIYLTLLKVPFIAQETFTIVVLTASIFFFLNLSKKQEFTALRSSGLSIMQFIAPLMITISVLGVIIITALNPIATQSLAKYERVEQKVFYSRQNITAVLESGIWLVENKPEDNTKLFINAQKMRLHKHADLENCSFLYLDNKFKVQKILHANAAILDETHWTLFDTTEIIPRQKPKKIPDLKIETSIKIADLKNSLLKPHKISIWELPYFIQILQNTGNNADAYISYFNKLLLRPFTAVLFITCAAMFMLQHLRGKKVFDLALKSLILGLTIHIATELSYIIGNSSAVPSHMISIGLVCFICLGSLLFIKRSGSVL